MIKVKLKYLINSSQALTGLLAMPLRTKAHYDLSKALKKCRDEVEDFQELYNKKIREFADEVLTEDGKPTGKFDFKTPEDNKKFNEEMKELSDSEVEVHLNPVPFKELGIPELKDKDEDKETHEKREKFANLGTHLSFLHWIITD